MASTCVTPRDIDILQALDCCPLTSRQLLKLSETFAYPFTCDRKVRARLQELADASRVLRWPLAIAGRGGSRNCYSLTRIGFQLLNGPKAWQESKRVFQPVALARQPHTLAISEFFVHAVVCAHRADITFRNFCRENSVCLTAGTESIYPDAAFQLVTTDGEELSYFVEMDNRSERVRSEKDTESWQKKIRVYEAFQDRCPKRFRVLVVSTQRSSRLAHILELAKTQAHNSDRSLFYVVALPDFLNQDNALHAPIFSDHQGKVVSVVPAYLTSEQGIAPLAPVCYSPAPAKAAPVGA